MGAGIQSEREGEREKEMKEANRERERERNELAVVWGWHESRVRSSVCVRVCV